jgi:hypothetical protein
MKQIAILLIVLVAGYSLYALAADAPKETGKQVYHVVAFKFKATTTPEQIKTVEDAFKDLKNKIPTITSLKYGANISPENRNKGFTHCWVLTFNSEKDRDNYLVDPAHKAFGGVVGPTIDDVFVLDFVGQE